MLTFIIIRAHMFARAYRNVGRKPAAVLQYFMVAATLSMDRGYIRARKMYFMKNATSAERAAARKDGSARVNSSCGRDSYRTLMYPHQYQFYARLPPPSLPPARSLMKRNIKTPSIFKRPPFTAYREGAYAKTAFSLISH